MEHTCQEQLNMPLRGSKKLIVKKESLLACAVLALVGLTGLVPAFLQNVCLLLVFVLSLVTGGTYLIYPVMLFYGNVLGIFAGMSVYRWYTLMFLVITLLKHKGFYAKPKQLAVFLLFVLYCLVVVASEDLRRAIFAVVDMVCVILLINCYLKEEAQLRKFFVVYVLCAFLAFFTGTRMENLEQGAIIGGEYVDYVRNMATFEDPNYMGYFYTVAVFALLGLKLFTPKIRVAMVIAVYAILITTLSVSAIVVNVLMWLAYLLVTRGIKVKTAIMLVLISALTIGIYQYGLDYPDTPFLGVFSMRVEEKINQMNTGDVDNATTNRSLLALRHLVYFWNQTPLKMLIGMNAASAIVTDLGGIKDAAHNEYVDWLLNVGILGTALMLYFLVSTVGERLKKYLQDMQDRAALGALMIKLVFVCYGFTLTLYGDYRFMLFLLI